MTEKTTSREHTVARALARELTREEIAKTSGGNNTVDTVCTQPGSFGDCETKVDCE